MRVTRTVREYIEKKVAEKVNAKYESEKLEAKRQDNLIHDFWSTLGDELENLAKERVDTFIAENSFVERGLKDTIVSTYSSTIVISDRHKSNSVHNWYTRAHMEIKEKVDDIVVALELGGNKDDLDRMLSEL